MFEQALKTVMALPETGRESLLDRLQDVRASGQGMGWGVEYAFKPRAPAIALLQDAMPRPGLPLVHFNDSCCGGVAELRA
jgi:hypothetical protein